MSRTPLAPVTPWPETLAQRYRAAGHWQDETLDAFWRDRADRFAQNTALIGPRAVDPLTRVRLTYREVEDEVAEAAGLLSGLGVEPGDRVLLQLPNVVEYVTSLFAILRLGALPIFALPAHREHEISQFCAIGDPAAHVVAGTHWGHDYRALATSVGTRLQSDGHVPPVLVDVETMTAGSSPLRTPAPSQAEDVAFLQLSGGTTGTPKLIPRTHADYLYSVRESAVLCGVDATTVMLVCLPAAHNFTMSSPGILGVLHRGGTLVLAPDASPRTAFSLIESERVTMTSLVPPLLTSWLASRARERFDLSSLHRLQVGGAYLPRLQAAQAIEGLDVALQQVFGMAEGLVNYTRLDDSDELILSTQGRPISPDDEVLVVDDDDLPVPDRTEGHLLTRGPYTIRGYYRAAEHNRSAFTADGFYRTGDLVRLLPSGHLQVTGRAKDQINRGGEKIAPVEIENVLIDHPGVLDAVVVAVPDRYLGESTCAFVITDRDDVDAAALRAHLRDKGLAPYKTPDHIRLVTSFPATGVGKTSRVQLRRQLAASLSAPTS